MRPTLLAPLLVLALAGCDWLAPGAAPGTVTGVVLYNGQPAAGKRVTLLPDGDKTFTLQDGTYTFTGVGEGQHQVLYQAQPDPTQFQADPTGAVPNEVKSWRTPAFSGGGHRLTAFDVSYNGLLYPDVQMSLIVSETSPVPFHFSPHVQGGRYRLRISSKATGEQLPTDDWSNDPIAIFAMAVEPGTYYWQVEFENHAGTGLSPERAVDLGP
ncbi:MAG: hypothetical protein ACLGIN_13790 [Candidatus Sericytochromatia bacterium]